MFNIEKTILRNSSYQFMKIRKIMLIFSIIFIAISILLLSFKGLNLGIDFKGGTLIEIKTKDTNISELRTILNKEFDNVSLQEFGDSSTIIIRLQNQNNTESIIAPTNNPLLNSF